MRKNEWKEYGKEPEFVKLYLKDIMALASVPHGQYKILLYLLQCATVVQKGELRILLPLGTKKEMVKELGIASLQSLNNAISRLNKAGLMIRKSESVYIMNPYIFGRGEWKNVKEIRMMVKYNLGGRTISSNVQNDIEVNTEGSELDSIINKFEESWKEEAKAS